MKSDILKFLFLLHYLVSDSEIFHENINLQYSYNQNYQFIVITVFLFDFLSQRGEFLVLFSRQNMSFVITFFGNIAKSVRHILT